MRHCLTDDGPQMDGDRPLDDVGRKQAKVMRKFYKLAQVSPDVIISSAFARAQQTAEAVQRGDTPIKTTPALDPDSTPEKALKAITKIVEGMKDSLDNPDNPSVLVVTHGPLIQPLLAAVAFCFYDQKWNYEHGSCAYINTSDSRFRWIVTPKLAAHLVGTNPKKVENTQEARRTLALELRSLSENLLRVEKASALNPLISKMRTALKRRWSRQATRVTKAIKNTASLSRTMDYDTLKQFAAMALPAADAKFQAQARKIRGYAYELGASHVSLQLIRPIEAKKPKPAANLPGADDGYIQDLEAGVDETSNERISNRINEAADAGLGLAALLTAVRQEMNGWSDADTGETARAETVAVGAVSNAYHSGGADYVDDWRGGNGPVEKTWDCEDDACEDCQANSEMGAIDSEAPFDSGDFEPPAHPNCRCSVSYQPVEETAEVE